MDNYIKDLREMRENNANFSAYYHKLHKGIKELKGLDLELFTFFILNAVRDIGFKAESKDYPKGFFHQDIKDNFKKD
jgi:hypothetical protein